MESNTTKTSILSLPRDALLIILCYLNPFDILKLDEAIPSAAVVAKTATQDPFLWRYLYQTHIPIPRGPPRLIITQCGKIDWMNAFKHAVDRQKAVNVRKILNDRKVGQGEDVKDADVKLNIEHTGSIRRIVSNPRSNNEANIVWDPKIAAARFDWSNSNRSRPNLALRNSNNGRRPITPSRTIPKKDWNFLESPFQVGGICKLNVHSWRT